jgi:hypothetical protein
MFYLISYIHGLHFSLRIAILQRAKSRISPEEKQVLRDLLTKDR